MVLFIYLAIILMGLIIAAIHKIVEDEVERRCSCIPGKDCTSFKKSVNVVEGIGKIYVGVLALFSIFALVYGIINVYWWLIVPSGLTLIAIIFGVISMNIDTFSDFTLTLLCIFAILAGLSLMLSFAAAPFNAVGAEKFGQTRLVGTTNIVAVKEAQYSNLSGMYVRTTPGELYYYDIKTASGGTYTKYIDGTKFYIEKFQDNKYVENPHIEEYEYVKSWENWFGFNVYEKTTYYRICVPENTIRFYET